MSAFLFFLIKLNLAMAAAIVLVALLRRPLRNMFGAPIAYAVWFLVPIAGAASFFPPRVVAPVLVPIAPVHVFTPPVSVPVMNQLVHSLPRVAEQLTGQSAISAGAIAPPLPASALQMPDTALLLFAAWALGTVLMTFYLIRLQLRFAAAARLREAGPAVLGFFRPRIVTPDSFQKWFTPREQAAILEHERVHLARQDARVNALTAFLRCLCWFNPLIHLGARWLRIDQELACDAAVVARAIPRGDYAKALLKSQMAVSALPVGCNWVGSQHPLIERIALLKCKPPGTARRLAGVSLVLLAATSVGLGAWAAQPPVVAKPAAVMHPAVARVSLPAIVAAPVQTPEEIGQPVAQTGANGKPTHSGKDASNILRVASAGSLEPAPAIIPAPNVDIIEAQNTVAPARAGAQAPAAAAGPVENVTVTGSRRMYHDFSRNFAAPTKMTGKIARWERRICPVVAGQNPHSAAFITQHLKYVALAAGAPVNTEADCAPNIDIIFTTTPQALLDTVSKNNQHYLGYFSSVAQKNALATVTKPIQAWYATESTDIKGRRFLDTGRSIAGGTSVQNFNGLVGQVGRVDQAGDNPATSAGSALTDMAPFFYSTGNHINDGIHTGFNHILIVIDSTKLAGQDIVPLADYIAVLALSQVAAPNACQELPSIVNRMASGCEHTPASLTAFDLAYLQALYHMSADRSLMAQRSEIGDLMTDSLEKSK